LAGQGVFVCEEEVERRQAGFNGQDVGGGTREEVCGPLLDLVPEGRKLCYHVSSGFEGIRTVAEDGEKEQGGQLVAQERRQAHPRGGEPFDGHEGGLGLGQPFGEVWGCEYRGGEPVAQPADLLLWGKD